MKKLGCVLLIDDSDADNFIHARRLNKLEIAEEIIVRANGQEGLDYFTAAPADGAPALPRPDLLFLDINMPVMDGWEFLDRYQHIPEERRARVTIVMLTSSVGDSDHERSRAYSVIDGHEAKPLTKEKLRVLLERHFGHYLPD